MPLIHDSRVSGGFHFFSAVKPFLSRFDFLQILPMLVLLLYGVFFVYGTGQQVGGIAAEVFWRRQIQWGSVGLGIWLVCSLADYRRYAVLAVAAYPVSILTLVYVLVNGVGRFGAKRWLSVFGMSIQPSEIAKILTIVFCAWILSRKTADVNKIPWTAAVGGAALLPMILILKQPNLSTALTLGICVCAVVFAARLKWLTILLIVAAVAVAAPVGYHMLRDYHRQRIAVFLNPKLDPLNAGWNQLQSELAVGSGGFQGKGFMQGTQNTLGYLPQTVSNSDFIFSVIAEETGFVGSIILILMYVLLMISILRTALAAPDDFGRYLCAGIAAMIGVHSIVNIGMCIRMMPVTGLPLPLVSYGGTFMIVTLTALGIVQSVYARRISETEEE